MNATACSRLSRWADCSRRCVRCVAGGRGGATKRTYDAAGSFSAKTNFLFDRLLGSDLFPRDIVESECKILRATAAPFGWLLDERGLTTNKTNIETELVASLCSAADQEDYYARIVRFIATTPAGWAFPDTYDAQSAARLGGEGRSQVGGVFAPLAMKARRALKADDSAPASCLPLQNAFVQNHNTPGSGLVEGDFDRVSFASDNATLSFRVTKLGLPPLRLVVMVGPESAATGKPAVTTPVIGANLTTVQIPIRSWDDADWPATIRADSESCARGWCHGAFMRTLRKQQLPLPPPDPPALSLRLDQPALFLTDDFVQARHGTHRRLIPVTQQRVGNGTFCSHKPHHYMQTDRPLSLSGTTLSFGMKVNYGDDTPPTVTPGAEAYDCSAALPASGDALPAWSCTARPQPADTTAAEEEEAESPDSGDSPSQEVWPIKTTSVRFYRQGDGDIALRQVQVLYTSVRHHVCSLADSGRHVLRV